MTVEAERDNPQRIIPDGTERLLAALAINPQADVRCSLHPGDPAVAVYATPGGCVARPDDRFQALCLQHIATDGISPGSHPVLDLTVGEAWSRESGYGELPLQLGFSRQRLVSFLTDAGMALIDPLEPA